MADSLLQSTRNQQILAGIVRAYVETGEPVSSLAVSRLHAEGLSSATIRNVMADLEDAGYLYQPHTSAGRVPTAAAYRFFAQQMAPKATLSEEDRKWIRSELDAATTPEEVTERAGHVLAQVSRGIGIIVMPPLARSLLEHIRFLSLPDGRVVVVLISAGGATRDKVVRPEHEFTQAELDRTADYLNRHYGGWTLEAIRADLLAKLASERERYGRLLPAALELCDPARSRRRPGAPGIRRGRGAVRFQAGIGRSQAVARASGGDRGKKQAGRASQRLHRDPRAGAHPDRRQGDQFRRRASLADHRALSGARSGPGFARSFGTDAHAIRAGDHGRGLRGARLQRNAQPHADRRKIPRNRTKLYEQSPIARQRRPGKHHHSGFQRNRRRSSSNLTAARDLPGRRSGRRRRRRPTRPEAAARPRWPRNWRA